MKRISSLLLALLMILTMSVTTFAAGATGTTETKGSITIENPKADETYTAYKIFDVVYSGENYSYTIDSNTNKWFNTVKTYADTEANGLKLTPVTGTTTYIVKTESTFSAADFSNVLKAAKSGKTGTPLTLAGGKASATGLELGYYFVTSESGALCNLTTTNPNVTIHDKNVVPFEKKVDKTSADVGDTVAYTITGKVPEYEGFSTYTYEITDTMSKGLTFNNDVTVKVGGTVVTSGSGYTFTSDTANPNKFTVSIPVKSYKVGAEIKVTYTATLNEKAVAQISTNKAILTYSNDPTESSKTDTIKLPETKVYSSKIQIDKYETDKTETKLKGAEFVLYKEEDSVKRYYKWNETAEKVEWVTDKDAAMKKQQIVLVVLPSMVWQMVPTIWKRPKLQKDIIP